MPASPPLRACSLALATFLAALGACGESKDRAPMAPQNFSGGVKATTPEAGTTVFDAGRPDAGTGVCTPGFLSVPYAPNDPCNQMTSSCQLSGSLTIALCQPDHTWGTCYCQSTIGAAGTTTGTSGLGF